MFCITLDSVFTDGHYRVLGPTCRKQEGHLAVVSRGTDLQNLITSKQKGFWCLYKVDRFPVDLQIVKFSTHASTRFIISHV